MFWHEGKAYFDKPHQIRQTFYQHASGAEKELLQEHGNRSLARCTVYVQMRQCRQCTQFNRRTLVAVGGVIVVSMIMFVAGRRMVVVIIMACRCVLVVVAVIVAVFMAVFMSVTVLCRTVLNLHIMALF